MELNNICQSCTMPMENDTDRGTEKDGSPSNLYCKYCYQQGVFRNPEMTLQKMQETVVLEMQKQHISEDIIQLSLNKLAGLERWRQQAAKNV